MTIEKGDRVSADTRPPLRMTHSEAVNWTRFHPEDHGREIIIIPWMPAEIPAHLIGQPKRVALGYNAAGAWVWQDEAEGRWP